MVVLMWAHVLLLMRRPELVRIRAVILDGSDVADHTAQGRKSILMMVGMAAAMPSCVRVYIIYTYR